jgi:hypothetical protein
MNFYNSGGIHLHADATNMNSSDVIFGNNRDWAIEYYNKGMNFWKPGGTNPGDYKLFLSDNGNVGIGTATPGVYKLFVTGRIRCQSATSTSYLTLSDKRLKEHVHSLDSSRIKLGRLNGVSYNYIKEVDSLRKKGHSKKHIGFLAQDLQKVYPELVEEIDSAGTLAIDYIGLIPVIIEAIKEQQAQIVALQIQAASPTSLASRVQALEKQLSQCCKVQPGNGKLKSDIISETGKETQDVLETSAIVLHQNSPNPFSQSTTVQMEIPLEVRDASLTVYNLAGEQKLSIAVNERGLTSVRIEAGKLNPGIYIYGIVADGELAASRQMVVTE